MHMHIGALGHMLKTNMLVICEFPNYLGIGWKLCRDFQLVHQVEIRLIWYLSRGTSLCVTAITTKNHKLGSVCVVINAHLLLEMKHFNRSNFLCVCLHIFSIYPAQLELTHWTSSWIYKSSGATSCSWNILAVAYVAYKQLTGCC